MGARVDVAVNWSALLGGQVAPWGIVATVVFLILTDRLVTRARLLQALAERDAWQKAYEQEKGTTTVLLGRERDSAVVGETVRHLLESMPLLQQRPGGDAGREPDSSSS